MNNVTEMLCSIAIILIIMLPLVENKDKFFCIVLLIIAVIAMVVAIEVIG